MVMTFVLHPLSHYNSITEPHARLLLSLIEDHSIDFPFHFILSLIDVYRDTTTVISSFSLRLSRKSFVIFLSLSLMLLSLSSWVPLTHHLFDKARPSFNWSGHELRQRLLQPLPFHPPLLPLLRVVVWCLRPSWRSLSTWMLTMIHSLLSCIRWTLMLVVSHDDRLVWVASPRLHLPLLLQRLLRTRILMMVLVVIVMRKWWLLNDLPFVIRDKKGE